MAGTAPSPLAHCFQAILDGREYDGTLGRHGKRKIKPADQQVQCSQARQNTRSRLESKGSETMRSETLSWRVMVRIPLQLTSQRTFPVRKHELDRAVQVGVAQSPRNFLLEFQVF
jgi:hypothetical protein